jgi:hypothetical protein
MLKRASQQASLIMRCSTELYREMARSALRLVPGRR